MLYTHCLRPQSTENILTYLLDGTSVNVIVPIDEERKRFIHDVEKCQLADNIRLLTVNMQICRADYSQFLRQLWQQYHDSILPDKVDSLLGILSDLKQSEQNFILVLDNFDSMAEEDVDAHFNQQFYENLNGLKGYRNVSLLLITQNPYNEMLFYIEGEFTTSKLDIQEVETLPPLLYDEVRHELKHLHKDLWCVRNLSDEHISHLMQQVKKNEGYDYTLLHFLLKQIRNHSGSLEEIRLFVKQLKLWQKYYNKQQISQLNYRVKKTFKGTSILTSISDLARTVFLDWPIVLIEKISDLSKRGK
ncbi:MAG: hypothetical protein QM487_03430 [Candidatus Marithrix sp.]